METFQKEEFQGEFVDKLRTIPATEFMVMLKNIGLHHVFSVLTKILIFLKADYLYSWKEEQN